MRIVQINTVCGTGSTGKIVADLYSIAEKAGYTPFIAYGRGCAPSEIRSFKIGNPFDFGSHVLVNFIRGKNGFASKAVTKGFLKWIDTINPDILHLHNLHGFYLHVGILFEYIKSHNIRVVWTLHDCWPMTGQCAYFDYAHCDKWKTSCHHCPVYRSDYPYSLFCDNSRQNYILKRNAFTGVKEMTIVTPSYWLADIVKKSFMNEYPVRVISNGINLELFSPSDKPEPTNIISSLCNTTTKIVLGVANVWSKRKGLDYFLQLINMLNEEYHIVLIGLSKKQQAEIHAKYGNRVTVITKTSNQKELATWYQRAYVYVNPTLEDNFPTTNLEALACGTPVITFNTGGSPECITDSCGIVVEKGNLQKLKEAILSIGNRSEITSSSCRKQALHYNKDIQFIKYIDLYRHIMN